MTHTQKTHATCGPLLALPYDMFVVGLLGLLVFLSFVSAFLQPPARLAKRVRSLPRESGVDYTKRLNHNAKTYISAE